MMHYMSIVRKKNMRYEDINKLNRDPIVYVVQEIPGTQAGSPKINIIGASQFGKMKFLLPEFSQIIFSFLFIPL